MMNLMGYDAMTIGNHEFDFGLENMAELFRMADFPVVCSNYDVTGTVLEGLVKPYITLVREGVKIGIFGLAPKMEGLVQADKCIGIVYNDPIKVAQEMTDLLREKENCEVVICMSHLGIRSANPEGASDENLVGKTRGIDVILGGHSHTFMEKPAVYLNADGKSVPVLHTGKSGIYVGEMVLTLTENSMMKRLTLLLWVAGLFILGLSSLHAQTGGPFLPSAADNRCRQWVDSVLSGLNVHEKWGSSSLPPFRPEQTRPRKADARAGKEIQGRWLAVFRRYSGRAGYLDQYGPEGCQDSRYGYFRWRVGTVNEAERRSGLSP